MYYQSAMSKLCRSLKPQPGKKISWTFFGGKLRQSQDTSPISQGSTLCILVARGSSAGFIE